MGNGSSFERMNIAMPLKMDNLPVFLKQHFIKGIPNLRRNTMRCNTRSDVLYKMLVIILAVRLKAIFCEALLLQNPFLVCT